ncbi:hypothetical protein [Caproicibacter sp.]|uniref:hypothetical protein n=1 Tax=Caproicibacter sp. TaxID=2814884 RepID=UPI00398A34A3
MLDQIANGVGHLLFLSIGNFLKISMLSFNSLSRSVTGSFLLIFSQGINSNKSCDFAQTFNGFYLIINGMGKREYFAIFLINFLMAVLFGINHGVELCQSKAGLNLLERCTTR